MRATLLTVLFLLISVADAFSQTLPGTGTDQAQVAPVPEDSLGRRTPRGTVNGFIKAVADQNYYRASQYLQLGRSQKKASERERIVKTFQRLLDQSGNIMPNSWISNKTTGRTDDDLSAGVDMVGSVTSNSGEINLYIENREADDAPAIWQFTSGTVNEIAAVHIEETFLDRALPQVLKEKMLGGVPIGHWLSVVLLIAAAYLFSWAVVALVCFSLQKTWLRGGKGNVSAFMHAVRLPARLYLAIWVFLAFSRDAGISIIVRQRLSSVTIIIGIIAFLIFLWRLSDLVGSYSQHKLTQRGRVSAISVILFLKRTARVAIVVFGFIGILGAIGIDITAGLAALGIGGIALALGAQKTVENLVGSVMLIADQPIRVGDFCKVGDISGTVEQIGMRSTTMRTGQRTLVTIPNGDLAASRIENYAHRDRFLFDPVFEFRTETTPDQVRFLLVELRSVLYAHPMVDPNPAKVRFTSFGQPSVKIEVWSYINAASFDDFQEVQEDLLLHMMEVIERSGTSVALPSRTLYHSQDSGISKERNAKISKKVTKWKQEGNLQLPKFDEKKIAALRGTLPYPPEGSAGAKEDTGQE